jgi:hypothetical protein
MGEEKKYTPVKVKAEHVVKKGQDDLTVDALNNASGPAAAKFSGVGGNRFPGDAAPAYNQTPSEYVINNERNSWIVLGVDRQSTKTTGYGGKGHTQCAAIDIVAGRMASYAMSVDDNNEPVLANVDFKVDAARVYISQKTDIDDYLELSWSPMGKSKSTSAIAVKADDVRLVARNGIKLVTGTDTRNSLGLRQMGVKGIELNAGDRGYALQPLVKGNNLLEYLKGLQGQVEDLREIVYSFYKYQSIWNQALVSHTHLSPFFGIPGSPAFEIMGVGVQTLIKGCAQTELSVVSHQTNMAGLETNYLNPGIKTYINSGYNKTN